MRERNQDWQAIPGANESPAKDLGSRRGVDYERVELPGAILPERHEHAGQAIFPTPTEYSGTASDRGVVRYRSKKPKRAFTQNRKLGSRAAPPVYVKILAAMATPAGTTEDLITGATARGKPTARGQRCKEMLALFVQVMRHTGYSPAAVQQVTGLSPSQVTRLSAHELPGLRSVADRVDWPAPTRFIDRETYTAPTRANHPARRTKFGANNSQTEEALRSTLDMLEEKVATLEADVVELKQQAGVLAANQFEQADRLDLLEGLGQPKAPRDVSAMLDRLAH